LDVRPYEAYEAYDTDKRRTVALKGLIHKYAQVEAFRARFLGAGSYVNEHEAAA
jgi:hypothetical protein